MAEDKRGETEGVDISSLTSASQKVNPYAKPGIPNYHAFRAHLYHTVSDMHTPMVVDNDYYLGVNYPKPVDFLHKSLGAIPARFKNYKRVSAFDSKTKKMNEFAEAYSPKHAHTEGGKGLTTYTRGVVMHTHGMSTITNYTLTSGCSASCFPYDAMVSTPEGPLTFSEIKERYNNGIETRVHTPGGESSRVIYFFDQGVKEVNEYELEDGLIIRCTPDHFFETMEDELPIQLSIDMIYGRGLPLIKNLSSREPIRIKNKLSLGPQPVCDIEVEAADSLFLLGSEVSAHNCAFCIPVDSVTNITPSNGKVKLTSDLSVGDEISSMGGQTFVTRRISTGKKPVFRYLFSDKRSLELTACHPVLMYKNARFVIAPISDVLKGGAFLVSLKDVTRPYLEPLATEEDLPISEDRYERMTFDLNIPFLVDALKNGELTLVSFVGVLSLGVKDVFDISVASPSGLFDINDIVVHNCKESLIGSPFTQVNFKETTGILKVDLKDGKEPMELSAKTKIKFFDTESKVVVYGPLQIALAYNFPIAKDSLRKLRDRTLVRLIAD